MFDTSFCMADMAATTVTHYEGSQGRHAIIVQSAWTLYQKASRQGAMRQAWQAVTRRSSWLTALGSLGIKPYAQHDGGRQTVAVDKIIGSENRVGDFDDQFYPLRSQSRLPVAGCSCPGGFNGWCVVGAGLAPAPVVRTTILGRVQVPPPHDAMVMPGAGARPALTRCNGDTLCPHNCLALPLLPSRNFRLSPPLLSPQAPAAVRLAASSWSSLACCCSSAS